MLITGICRKVKVELDERKSALLARYLIHYSQMFAYLGLIISALVAIDYICYEFYNPQTKNEIIANRYYKVTDNINRTEYYFFTDSYHFLSKANFYEKTNIGDDVTIHFTPIFKTIIKVSNTAKQGIDCKPFNIYGWPLCVVGLTFICSLIVIVRTWGWKKKRAHFKYDKIINFGAINILLCIITLVAVFYYYPFKNLFFQ